MNTPLTPSLPRRLLLSALIGAALPLAANAAVPSLADSLAQLDSEQISEFIGRPGARVRDAAQFERMKTYLRTHYEGVVARHHFELSPGEVFDCVDMLTQPGARRHGLTAANWVSKPSLLPVEAPAAADEVAQEAAPQDRPQRDPGIFLSAARGEVDAEGHAKACAKGTIPMKRLTLQRLAAFESLEHFRHKRGRPQGGDGWGTQASVHEYAHAYDYVTNWGAESTLNIWRAYTELNSEFSLSQIWVTGGSPVETIEAGWQVYPDRQSSHKTDAHLFIYSTQDGYANTGCYDLTCDDFVQTNNSVAIGGYYTNHSVVNGTQYASKILIQKDGTLGHWWIAVDGVYAGYYPRTLYDTSGIRNQAAKVDFGGEIINSSPSGRHTRTDMGSGYKPSSGYGYAAYQRTIRYVNTSNVYATPSLTETRTKSACYDIDVTTSTGTWKTYFYFGGEGYGTGC
ncbi:neprosin family prolyl endopeptidase [Ideonella sp. DXS29W]|uniref:Neprosin family prolyl endopeptidase n=1 Tax=Ideonella lacteola TaxID=2984193 RepID=A0ABU9BU37_9BURK